MKRLRRSAESVLLPEGFAFSTAAAGIKASGRSDLAFVEAVGGSMAAAVFTSNRVVAAPVDVGRAFLKKSGGRLRAVLVNSGNANCANGKAGLAACLTVCNEAAELLNLKVTQIFPSSTGIIGVPLPVEKISAVLPKLIADRRPTTDAAAQFAEAILTTDTRSKIASRQIRIGPRTVRFLGIAKGSGMIHPQLATMLVYIFTDAVATVRELRAALTAAVEETFNRISVDGDTSTNDTVLMFASGKSGVRLMGSAQRKLTQALREVSQSLAEQVVTDGEGAQHVIRLVIEQAKTREEALQVARTIAHSLLVKTAWAGADPNWGRILAAVGRSGISVDPGRIRIYLGDQMVCRKGAACTFHHEKAHLALSAPECEVRVQLGRGRSEVQYLTTDLTSEYVAINAHYST